MKLPTSIDNVPYYNNYYNGDLIITDSVIYYFPHTDLTQENIDSRASSRTPFDRIILKGLFALFSSMAYITGLRGSNRSRIRKDGLWRADDTSANLQIRLDAHISNLKKQRQPDVRFSTTLPIPTRFSRDEIQNMALSSMGALTFHAHHDHHDFKVGVVRKGLLRQALKSAGLSLSE